jgi:uncharacterized protein (TIGR02594 family)
MSVVFTRSVFVLLCLVITLFTVPASARPHHNAESFSSDASAAKRTHWGYRKYSHRKYRKSARDSYRSGRKARHARLAARRHHLSRQHVRYRSVRAARHVGRAVKRTVAVAQNESAVHEATAGQSGVAAAPASLATIGLAFVNEVNKGLVNEARRFIGTNPTDRRSLWCARFMNFVLKRTGRKGTGSDMARSFASYGHRVGGPQVGAIAVLSRGKRGGHVGVVSGVDNGGNPIIISGNHGRRVAESKYPSKRVIAYVMP